MDDAQKILAIQFKYLGDKAKFEFVASYSKSIARNLIPKRGGSDDAVCDANGPFEVIVAKNNSVTCLQYSNR